MIKLYNLLLEQVGQPKAIILSGAPGAGKGYVLKGLDLSNIKVLNVDNRYVDNLKQANVSLDLKNSSPEDRSKQAIAMSQANKDFDKDVEDTIKAKESFILDGTAASYKKTVELKNELEEAGYEVFMLYVYTDLERSLKQNEDRFEKSGGEDRSLMPAIVLKTWNNVTQNHKPYKELFKDNFVSVANTLEDEKIDNLEDIIDKYLTPFKPKNTKPKTAARQRYADKQKEKLNKEIKVLLDGGAEEIINTSVSADEARAKINMFLK
jgi:adenylate kinase family enzyme|tara:strand:+ start:6998 stop:7792 length:795 start_codon:yes stop_codon:yes gene_type:complete